ncbi:MAG: Gene 25-like lysozyme [Methanosaeta sp. PtaB.Bin039]|nr:MAG: Gene 25-like lysozyme [Methanosaeta sp. PtaB.Bin039]
MPERRSKPQWAAYRERNSTQSHRDVISLNLDYPFGFDATGRTSDTDDADHIRDMIEQLLLTSPGERVNRPDFGAGLMRLIFAPNSDELAAATQFLIQGALQQWLGDLISVESVLVEGKGAELQVTIHYVIRRTQQRQSSQFSPGES